VPGLEPAFKSGGLRIHSLTPRPSLGPSSAHVGGGDGWYQHCRVFSKLYRSSQSFSTRYARALISPNTQNAAP
jgi:hypothetical protein